jgi:hypothetical protein
MTPRKTAARHRVVVEVETTPGTKVGEVVRAVQAAMDSVSRETWRRVGVVPAVVVARSYGHVSASVGAEQES